MDETAQANTSTDTASTSSAENNSDSNNLQDDIKKESTQILASQYETDASNSLPAVITSPSANNTINVQLQPKINTTASASTTNKNQIIAVNLNKTSMKIINNAEPVKKAIITSLPLTINTNVTKKIMQITPTTNSSTASPLAQIIQSRPVNQINSTPTTNKQIFTLSTTPNVTQNLNAQTILSNQNSTNTANKIQYVKIINTSNFNQLQNTSLSNSINDSPIKITTINTASNQNQDVNKAFTSILATNPTNIQKKLTETPVTQQISLDPASNPNNTKTITITSNSNNIYKPPTTTTTYQLINNSTQSQLNPQSQIKQIIQTTPNKTPVIQKIQSTIPSTNQSQPITKTTILSGIVTNASTNTSVPQYKILSQSINNTNNNSSSSSSSLNAPTVSNITAIKSPITNTSKPIVSFNPAMTNAVIISATNDRKQNIITKDKQNELKPLVIHSTMTDKLDTINKNISNQLVDNNLATSISNNNESNLAFTNVYNQNTTVRNTAVQLNDDDHNNRVDIEQKGTSQNQDILKTVSTNTLINTNNRSQGNNKQSHLNNNNNISASNISPPQVANVNASSSTLSSSSNRKPCNCTKSMCLKLYCDCFAMGSFCHDCNCINCFNTLEHEDERNKAIKMVLDRNPQAFQSKIGKFTAQITMAKMLPNTSTNDETLPLNTTTEEIDEIQSRHIKGCNCKKSNCLKRYCECYLAKIQCSTLCKCVGCKNCDESTRTLLQLANAADLRKQQMFMGMQNNTQSQNQQITSNQMSQNTHQASYNGQSRQMNSTNKQSTANNQNKFNIFNSNDSNENGYEFLNEQRQNLSNAYTMLTAEIPEITCSHLIGCVSEKINQLDEEDTQNQNYDEMLEALIIEEFGRCLVGLIETAEKEKSLFQNNNIHLLFVFVLNFYFIFY